MLYKASGFFSTTLHLFSVFHEIKKHQLLDFLPDRPARFYQIVDVYIRRYRFSGLKTLEKKDNYRLTFL